MHDHAMTGCILWSQVILVLAVAAAVIVVGAAAAARAFRSAVWKRTIWQAAAAALCGLVLLELLGAGEALIRLSRAASAPATSGPNAVTPTAPLAPAERPPLLAESPEPAVPPADVERPWPPAVVEWAPLEEPRGDELTSFIAPQVAAPAEEMPAATIPQAEPGPAGAARWPGLVWGIGAAAILGRAAWTRFLLRRFRQRHGPAGSESLRRRVDGLARRLGVRRPVCLLEASGLRVPVAFGLVRPTLVLPASFAGEFSDREQEAILAHELAHLAARDPLWQLVADVLSAALWWHPLVWWLRGRLRTASEAAADEASLLVPGGPDVLAACLVALGRKLVHSRRLGWLSIEGPPLRSGLGRRVERLLSLQAGVCRAPAPVRPAIARIALPLALVVVSVFSTAWARPQATFQEGETTMSLVKSSFQRSLAAIALAAWLGPASASPAADEKPPVKEVPPPAHAAPLHPGGGPADAEPGHPGADEIFMTAAPKPQPGPKPAPHALPDPKMMELLQKRGKLEMETRELERKLGQLRDDQDQEAKEVFERLRKVQREIREITQQLPLQMGSRMVLMEGMRGPQPAKGMALPGMAPPGTGGGMSFGGGAGSAPAGGGAGFFAAFGASATLPALSPEERQRRMKQVHQAAEKLREAGLPEQADRLIREAEAIFSGAGTPGVPSPLIMPGMGAPQAMRPGGPSDMMSAPMYPGMMSPPQGMPSASAGGFGMMSRPVQAGMAPGDPASREIRDQLRQLQKQIEELRRELQEVKEGKLPRPSARPKREGRPAGDDPFADRPKADTRPEKADPLAKPAKGDPERR